MLLLFFISFFFIWLIYREFRRPKKIDGFTTGYIGVCLILGILAATPMIRHWQFENFLESKAEMLTDGEAVSLKCTTALESMFDRYGATGMAYFGTGKIVLQYPSCKELRGFLKNPRKPSRSELWSLNTFTHEAMHIRGERNEAKTECQAVQRNHRAAMLLGVNKHTAERAAVRYFRELYPTHRGKHYVSKDCAPGKAMDEKLSDAVWQRAAKESNKIDNWARN